MEKENYILLGLGSNFHAEENVGQAVRLLREVFPSLRFSVPEETEAVDFILPGSRFLNCVAWGSVPFSRESLQCRLKSIERRLGRQPGDKQAGRIPIDIDLVCWNGCVLKEGDWNRPYIQQAIAEVVFPPL